MSDANDAAQERERVTVTLTAKAAAGLARLLRSTGLSKTDIVNDGISLYDFVDQHVTAGAEVLVRYPDGTERWVTFL
jgi:hypothetical protein